MLWELLRRHPREGFTLVRAFAGKVWWLPPLVVSWLYICSAAAAPAFEGWGFGHASARVLAAVLLATTGTVLAVVSGRVLSGVFSRMRPPTALLVVGSLPGSVYVCALLNGTYGVPLATSLAMGLTCSLGAFAYVRSALAKIPTQVRVAVWLDDPTRAEDLVRACERELLDPSLTSDERAAVEVNLASGLAVLASQSDRDDALPRAYEILTRSLAAVEPTGGSLDIYVGATRLSEAMAVKASRTGDVEGYEEALQLMLDAAGTTAQLTPGTLPRALLIHATHLTALSRRVAADGHPGHAARLHAEALEDLLRAIDGSSPRRSVHALAQLEFASLVDRSSGDLDAAIALCRVALRRLRLRPRLNRDHGRLVLCDLLADRAIQGAAHAECDLAEATRLCLKLRRRPPSHAQAERRLPGLLSRGGSPTAEVTAAYRNAFDELSLMSGTTAGDIAAEWAGWATTPAEAAEAHWCWIRAMADDIRRRPLRAEKERRLGLALGLAATAGERLIVAGRDRDAAVALDLGRAVLLTELVHRDRDGIGERLVAAGRSDLADRWARSLELTVEADRAGFAPAPATSNTMLVGGHRFQQLFTTPHHLVLADREQLLREIGHVPGCDDVDAPLSYDDLRAAAADGPIVYLSATASGTRAVIVTDTQTPVVLSLPLTATEIARAVARPHEGNDELTELLPWLWDVVIGHVAAAVAPASLVTLIPLGLLSLLPLHVAGMTQGDDGVWHDRTADLVFRYAPNARVLGRAQTQARSLDDRTRRVLTAAAPDAAGRPRLESAQAESDGVLARFACRAEQPDPSPAAVLDAMDRCGIWHLACHGSHNPVDPLESSLSLRDGRLTLRTIFARPRGSRRLAVLSACQTAIPGEALLDEVVSFPSALLAAGVAGVVCTQTDVEDGATILLILRFFDELARGSTPARALARAQRWLCNASNAEIHAALPDVYPVPSDRPASGLERWEQARVFTEPDCWAPFIYCGA